MRCHTSVGVPWPKIRRRLLQISAWPCLLAPLQPYARLLPSVLLLVRLPSCTPALGFLRYALGRASLPRCSLALSFFRCALGRDCLPRSLALGFFRRALGRACSPRCSLTRGFFCCALALPAYPVAALRAASSHACLTSLSACPVAASAWLLSIRA
jgi:hypothetical protein